MGRIQAPPGEENKMKKEEGKTKRSERHIMKWESDVPLPTIPDTNFASFLLDVMAHHGGKKALVDAATGKHHTYSDICAIVPRVCANFAAAGVRAGDGVLLLSPNHINFPIAYLAIQLLPATCVPASTSFSPEEMAHVVRLSGVRWAVVEESVLGVVQQAMALLPPNTLKQLWVIGSSLKYPSFSDLMRMETQDAKPLQAKNASSNQGNTVALIPFSSGTTGLPKGVMLPHRCLLTLFMQNKCLRNHSGQDDEVRFAMMSRVLLCMPLYHSYGNSILIGTLSFGGCLVLMTKFSLRDFLGTIQSHKITYTPIVPHIANFLAHSPLLNEYDISSLMTFGCGSAPLTPSTFLALTERTGRKMGTAYGLTETCSPVTINNPQLGFKLGSVGRVAPYFELKIVGAGGSEGLPAGEMGEVWVRGPGVMCGYTQIPGAAPSPSGLTEDGWLLTGDLGYFDDEGFLFITDRIKDILKVKGFQVSPNELETVLGEVTGVKEVAVVGVPSERLGEAPRAYIVPVPPPSPQAIKDYVAARLAAHKHLAGGVEVVDALPKNALGKVIKKSLRENYIQGMKKEAVKGATLSSKL